VEDEDHGNIFLSELCMKFIYGMCRSLD
jgi:hypothetical protein